MWGGGGEGGECVLSEDGGVVWDGVCACEGRGGRVYQMSVKVSNVFTNYWSQDCAPELLFS